MLVLVLPLTLLGTTPQSGPEPDSARIRHAIEGRQADFERDRRRLLPITTAGLGKCEERVGRFCYWYDESEPPPPPEPPAITRRRDQWLVELTEAFRQLPSDGWIAGQLVRYLVEAGRPDSAAEAAQACRAEGWWCLALEGMARHAGYRFAEANSLFDQALEAMPAEERCRWNDLRILLEGPEAGPYRRLGCRQRDSANAALYWRGVPSRARAGNDLRSEVLSRQVLVRTLEGAVNHHGIRMGADLAEVVLRYGWAEAYGRRAPRIGSQDTGIDVVGHEPKPAYPLLAPGPGWPPAPERPRFRYAPTYLARLDRLEDVQLARFRRDSGTVIVAGYRIPRDSVHAGKPVSVALVVTGSAPEPAAVTRTMGSLRGAIRSPALAPGGLVSLEVFDSDGRGLAVHRASLDSLSAGISDLLLLADPEGTPASLEEAAALAGTGWRFEAGSAVGLYWETYGVNGATDPAAVRISVEPARRGFLGRTARTLGLVGERRTLRLAWHQGREPRDGVASHSVALDLGQLGRGRYRLVIEVERDGLEPLRAERWVELVRPLLGGR